MKYTITRSKRAKRIILKVDELQAVQVTAPPRVPQKKIEQFIDSQQTWIKAQIKKVEAKTANIETDTHIKIFGRDYSKLETFDPKKPVGIRTNSQRKTVIFNFPPDTAVALIKKETILFLKKAARKYLLSRTDTLAQKMQLEYKQLRLKNQKSRWGSCSSQGNLNLNWRLVHYDTALIDYVIIHELAHLEHHNHSRRFWNFVAQFDPDYKLHRKQLKQQGVTFA